MVGGEDNQVLVLNSGPEPRNPGVELQEARREPGDVVAVAPALIELDHVGEEEAAVMLASPASMSR